MRLHDVLLRTIRQVKSERDQDNRNAVARLVGAFVLSVGVHAFLLVVADLAIA